MYLDESTAKDVIFLKGLDKDPRMMLPQTPITNTKINTILTEETARIDKWENMLYNRQPMYAKKFLPAKPKAPSFDEITLLQIQYRTRRLAFQQLVNIKRLFNIDFTEMLKYIEQIMCEFYAIKTNRVFPRKFEFTSEIYNIVGLGYLKLLKVSPTLMKLRSSERMCAILRIPKEKKTDEDQVNVVTKFGDRKGFTDPEAVDTNYFAYKQNIDHFDKRLLLAKYPIEKCYIMHEMARLHLCQRKLDETKQLGVKIIEQANLCGNYVWLLHGKLTIIRGETAQGYVDEVGDKLEELISLEQHFDDSLGHYLRTALLVNKIMSTEKEQPSI